MSYYQKALYSSATGIIMLNAHRKKEKHYGYYYRPDFLYVVHDY